MKKSKLYKECMGSLMLCHPAISHFSMSVIYFVIACKMLKIAQIVQVNKLCQRLNLIGAYADAFEKMTSAKIRLYIHCARYNFRDLRLVGSPFCDGRVTLLARLTCLHYYKHFGSPSRINSVLKGVTIRACESAF